MEVLIGLVAVGFVAAVPVAFILAIAASSRSRRLEQTVQQLQRDVAALRSRARFEPTESVEPTAARLPAAEPASVVAPAAPVRPAAPPPSAPEPPAPAPPAEPAAEAPVTPPPEAPAAPAPDFATNLGPRILVAMGALAVVTFLGLFVRYAWENNWVGPVGRIILGAAGSLSLLGVGLRLLDREMRPLGQGLAAIGLAGLYVCAFAAHSFYALVPSAVAGLLMLAVTVSGVLLADRLDARLLAGLAWVGGYLTPILLSTGEDKAWTLYGYLLLLAVGALVLDHRKPWGETMPLALFGTMVLYGGWYAEHFRPERFEVAAFGLVLFTGVFAFGMANKDRGPWLVVVALLAGLGLSVLAGGADRPVLLIPMSLLIAGLALRGSLRFGVFLALPAAVIAGLPFVVWAVSHYHPVHFGAAAAWIVGAGLLFVFGLQGGATDKPRDLGHLLAAGLVVGGGCASIALAAQTDRPGPILALLAAQAAMAALLRARGWGVEAVQAALAAVSVVAWYERFFEPGREPAVWLLTFGVAVIYLGLFLGKGLAGTAALGFGGVAGHLIVATFVWSMLFRVLYDTRSAQLALISVALAAFYLAAGLLAKQRRPQDALQVRVLLGLAAGFVTLAIPVRMGLHGITIAWAVEGLLLLSLGRRFDSRLARLGGDLVLMFAVVRLFVRHAPLHTGPFTPFANPAFGTWLFVIAVVGVTAILGRYFRGEADRNLSTVLCVLTLALLFGVLTHETQEAFDQRARVLLDLRDTDGATAAQREGGVAISVLWTLFATGLLAGGLLLRSRPLFYTGYALFAVTAAKVAFVDLATFPPLYRMLSILALGVLLLAGAWLNLRFRERLMPAKPAG